MLLNGFLNRSASPLPMGVIAHDDMVEAIASGQHTVIDVREVHEHRSGHIAGSINIPLSNFHPANVPTDKPIIVYCATGGRSSMAMQILQSAGITNVRNYRPGIAGWRMQGGALV